MKYILILAVLFVGCGDRASKPLGWDSVGRMDTATHWPPKTVEVNIYDRDGNLVDVDTVEWDSIRFGGKTPPTPLKSP